MEPLIREEIIIIEKKQPEETKPTDEIITNKEQNNSEIIIQEIQKENEELIIVPEIAKAIETEKVDEKKADNITFGEIVKIGILLPTSYFKYIIDIIYYISLIFIVSIYDIIYKRTK